MKRSILFACLALGLTIAGCKGQAGAASGTAAIVNGDEITMDQFYKYLMLKPTVQVLVVPENLVSNGAGPLPQQPYNGQVMGSLGLQALNDLIQQAILRQYAKDEGVFPTEQEIKDELDDRQKTNANFIKDYTAAGYSIDMIRNDLGLQLAQFKLTTKGIKVSDDEVNKYIEDHPKEFTIPVQVDLSWILVPNEKKAAADAAIKSGMNFVDVAAKYSEAPDRDKNHDRFPEMYLPRLANYGAGIMEAVQKTNELQPTPWIAYRGGWAKFFVNKKTPEKKVPIDDALRKRVRKALMIQTGAKGKDLDQHLKDRLKTAKVEVKIDSLKEAWQRSLDNLKAAGNAPGAATPATGTTAGTGATK